MSNLHISYTWTDKRAVNGQESTGRAFFKVSAPRTDEDIEYLEQTISDMIEREWKMPVEKVVVMDWKVVP